MTTEPEATYVAPPPFPEAGYIVFGIPDVPFSSVRLPLVWNINELNVLVAQAMEAAKLVQEAFNEAFYEPVTGTGGMTATEEHQRDLRAPAPQRAQQAPQRSREIPEALR